MHLRYGPDDLHEIVELGADGSFRLVKMPVGTFELRVGTRDQLRSGSYRHRRVLEVPEQGLAFLEIDVGE